MRFAIAVLPHTFPQRADPSALEQARHWASAAAQAELRQQLESEFDGFAVAVRFRAAGGVGVEHPEVWADHQVALWSSLVPPKGPGFDPVRLTEASVFHSPRSPLFSPPAVAHTSELVHRGQTTKSDTWLRWVIAHLGAHPGEDQLVNYFSRQPVPEFTTMLTLEGTLS